MKRQVVMTGGGPWDGETLLIDERALPVIACPYGQSTYSVQRQEGSGRLVAVWDGQDSR